MTIWIEVKVKGTWAITQGEFIELEEKKANSWNLVQHQHFKALAGKKEQAEDSQKQSAE